MPRYTNKLVEFFNGANTIAISGVRDFKSLKSISNKLGLDVLGCDTYWDLLLIAERHLFAINHTTILIEYQPFKGFSIGYKTYDESIQWYGMKPWTMTEVMQSINDVSQ